MEWIDPNNWSIENFNPATPHVERIPCEHDTVVFKPSNSFSIVVPDVPINIGALKVGNQVSINLTVFSIKYQVGNIHILS